MVIRLSATVVAIGPIGRPLELSAKIPNHEVRAVTSFCYFSNNTVSFFFSLILVLTLSIDGDNIKFEHDYYTSRVSILLFANIDIKLLPCCNLGLASPRLRSSCASLVYVLHTAHSLLPPPSSDK